jgi:hypothetical protein
MYDLGTSAVNLLFLSAVLFQRGAGIKPCSTPAAQNLIHPESATMSFKQILEVQYIIGNT